MVDENISDRNTREEFLDEDTELDVEGNFSTVVSLIVVSCCFPGLDVSDAECDRANFVSHSANR